LFGVFVASLGGGVLELLTKHGSGEGHDCCQLSPAELYCSKECSYEMGEICVGWGMWMVDWKGPFSGEGIGGKSDQLPDVNGPQEDGGDKSENVAY
jgi:hypothetical protein